MYKPRLLIMTPIYTSHREYIKLVFTYLNVWILDKLEYYYIYMILALPACLFGAPIINIQQRVSSHSKDLDDANSESDDEGEIKQYDVFICQLIFVFKSTSKINIRVLNGAQLRPLVDKKGMFFIGHIQRYYPQLDTIIIKYLKFPCASSNAGCLIQTDLPQSITRVLDVEKRYDVRNGKSCKLGIMF